MTTQPIEAVGSESAAVDAKADALKAFEDIAAEMLPDEQEEETPVEAEEGAEPETDEVTEDDIEDEAEDDDLPPIEPPVSWDAEAKETFKNLPREAQEIVAKREGERERFVQQKSQEATRAKQETERAAIEQLAGIERGYAEQFQQAAARITPQRPNPAMAQTDPAQFYALQAQYEDHVAQQRELQQHAQAYAQQAQQREAQVEQAYHAEQHQKIVEQFPEYTDPTTGPKLQAELSTVAKELGYPDELIGQARADDILAMKKAAEWKAKADKLDRLEAKKMEKVRAAKGLPKVAKPGVAAGSAQLRANRADAAWQTAKASKGEARDAALADYFKSQGIL